MLIVEQQAPTQTDIVKYWIIRVICQLAYKTLIDFISRGNQRRQIQEISITR